MVVVETSNAYSLNVTFSPFLEAMRTFVVLGILNTHDTMTSYTVAVVFFLCMYCSGPYSLRFQVLLFWETL